MEVNREKFEEWYRQQTQLPGDNKEIAWQAYRQGATVAQQDEGEGDQGDDQGKPGTLGLPPQQGQKR